MRINRLPIEIIFNEYGGISFERLSNFATIVDSPEQGVQAIIDEDGIYIGANTEIFYGVVYDYKQMGELLAWLQSFNLQMPKFKKQQ